MKTTTIMGKTKTDYMKDYTSNKARLSKWYDHTRTKYTISKLHFVIDFDFKLLMG